MNGMRTLALLGLLCFSAVVVPSAAATPTCDYRSFNDPTGNNLFRGSMTNCVDPYGDYLAVGGGGVWVKDHPTFWRYQLPNPATIILV